MKFIDRNQQRIVCETMDDLLAPMKKHCNKNTKEAIEITLRILAETEVENGTDGKQPEEKAEAKKKNTIRYASAVPV